MSDSPKTRKLAVEALSTANLAQIRSVANDVRKSLPAQAGSLGASATVLLTAEDAPARTHAAEAFAHELGLDLFRVDLSSVVSKFIGETEKNLKRLFDEAQRSQSILFFDEADALFGKRTEVKDSHDSYANVEVSYLLQRIEAYQGVVLLATNLRQNIDEAFRRRLLYELHVPKVIPKPRR